jgi:hypothetical protein
MVSGPAKVAAVRGEGVTFSVRKSWQGTVLNVRALCGAIAAGTVPDDCVLINQRGLNAHAKTRGEPIVAADPAALTHDFIVEGFRIALVAEGSTR